MWEYNRKLWTFAGSSTTPWSGLNDFGDWEQVLYSKYSCCNQLNMFDPVCGVWQNVHSHGNIPSPRHSMAQTMIEQNVWFYGGKCNREHGGLYQLNMHTLIWTKILNVGGIRPGTRFSHTFTALQHTNQIVLYGGCSLFGGFSEYKSGEPCIFDLASLQWKKYEGSPDDGRSLHSATAVNNGIIVIGGNYDMLVSKCSNVFRIKQQPISPDRFALQSIKRNLKRLKPKEWNMPAGYYAKLD